MAHRTDLNTLTPAERTQLINLMLNYLTDAVVADHMSIVHSGLELFTGHRAYLLGMENYLTANGGGAFAPLPFWNSASPIPAEFNVVKNPGLARPPLVNLNPGTRQRAMLRSCGAARLCASWGSNPGRSPDFRPRCPTPSRHSRLWPTSCFRGGAESAVMENNPADAPARIIRVSPALTTV